MTIEEELKIRIEILAWNIYGIVLQVIAEAQHIKRMMSFAIIFRSTLLKAGSMISKVVILCICNYSLMFLYLENTSFILICSYPSLVLLLLFNRFMFQSSCSNFYNGHLFGTFLCVFFFSRPEPKVKDYSVQKSCTKNIHI